MYTYIKSNGKVGPDILDIVTDRPNIRLLEIMCSSIWDWDLLVDRVEVSDKIADEMGLEFYENGETRRGFRWSKCPIPLPVSVLIVKKPLPEGVFAIAWSDLPREFPASCYLTDEEHACNRFYNAAHKDKT